MPTYQYRCKKCSKEFEEIQKITATALTKCPFCKTKNLVRVIGSSAGLVFKGSGYYLTDYKKSSSASEGKSMKSESNESTKKQSEQSSSKKEKSKPDK